MKSILYSYDWVETTQGVTRSFRVPLLLLLSGHNLNNKRYLYFTLYMKQEELEFKFTFNLSGFNSYKWGKDFRYLCVIVRQAGNYFVFEALHAALNHILCVIKNSIYL